jgi:hypothetical protein
MRGISRQIERVIDDLVSRTLLDLQTRVESSNFDFFNLLTSSNFDFFKLRLLEIFDFFKLRFIQSSTWLMQWPKSSSSSNFDFLCNPGSRVVLGHIVFQRITLPVMYWSEESSSLCTDTSWRNLNLGRPLDSCWYVFDLAMTNSPNLKMTIQLDVLAAAKDWATAT